MSDYLDNFDLLSWSIDCVDNAMLEGYMNKHIPNLNSKRSSRFGLQWKPGNRQ